MPTEEHRFRVLASNKALHRPLDREELQSHREKHDQEMSALRRKWKENTEKLVLSGSVRRSKFTELVVRQERREWEERESREKRKRQMAQRRKRYGELVTTLFTPTISPLRTRESELMREKLTVGRKSPKPRSLTPQPFRPRKFKPNPLVPIPHPPRTPSPLDYLADQRRLRMHYEATVLPIDHPGVTINWDKELNRKLSPSQLAVHVQEQSQRLERDSQRKALMLSHAHPANPQALDLGEQLDTAMLEAIKAKLSVLDLANTQTQ